MEWSGLSLQELMDAAKAFLPKILIALLIFLAARLISGWVTKSLRRTMKRRDMDREMIVLLEMLTRWGILSLGVVLAIEQIAPGKISALLAGLGIAGFTIGFALQDVAKNFIAGILLLLQQPFDIGDGIAVGDQSGTVLSINLRATELRSWDGLYVVIPNADVYMSPIINYSRAPSRRIGFELHVALGTDMELVTTTVLAALNDLPGLLEQPAPQVAFSAFGGSSLNFQVYYWIDTGVVGYMGSQDAGGKLINAALKEAGIKPGIPSMEVYTRPL